MMTTISAISRLMSNTFDEAEFLEDIPEVLKLGVAEYELDQEEDGGAE